MRETFIHPSALVEDGAKIGKGVHVEAFAVIKSTVELKDNVTIKSHAYIDGNTTIGEGTDIYPSVVIGTQTQDLKYGGETTYVRIGKNCQIREFTTINSSCGEGGTVEVGDNCFLMACCHVAHQCKVGSNVVMANSAVLAGHVHVGDHVIIGGMTPIHQFSRIGCHAMVGGMSRVTHDVPPYTVGGGVPYKLGGINLIGLKRRNFSMETRTALSRCFRLLYRAGLKQEEALDRIAAELPDLEEVRTWLDFCRNSSRGLIGIHGVGAGDRERVNREKLKELIPAN